MDLCVYDCTIHRAVWADFIGVELEQNGAVM